MTNEQAIYLLKGMRGKAIQSESEALDMAIEALNFVSEHHQSNMEAYAHDMGVSLEQAERELRVEELSCSEKPNRSDLVKESGDLVNDLVNDCISRQDAIDAVNETIAQYIPYLTRETNGIPLEVALAIKRLPSAQPELCEDAVSRNAIIRTLNTMDRYVSEELTLCDTDEKYPKNEVFIVDDVYEEIVEKLPSAQPEPEHTMEEFMYGQELGDPEDGSL